MKKILIVEDEPEMSGLIRTRLQSAGYDVISAANGREGLDIVRKEGPDLIIADVLMPVMDGFSFYKELKKNKSMAEIPVIILTARGKMEDSFMVMGADEFIAKPFKAEDLLEKIGRLMERSGPKVEVKTGTRVLVAGSDTETVETMVMQLKRAGCHTDLVQSGAQVISKAVLFLPNLIVMEVQMGDMESHMILGVLRKMPQFEKAPILVYSYYRLSELGSEDIRQRALSVDAAEQACMEAGATEYLGRFNENSFMKAVGKYLK